MAQDSLASRKETETIPSNIRPTENILSIPTAEWTWRRFTNCGACPIADWFLNSMRRIFPSCLEQVGDRRKFLLRRAVMARPTFGESLAARRILLRRAVMARPTFG